MLGTVVVPSLSPSCLALCRLAAGTTSTFQWQILIEHDGNPAVHYIDIITRHSMDISFDDLALQYKNAIMHKDLDLLRRPFGPKVAVPKDTKLQFVILDSVDGTVTVFKHYIFPKKCKPSFVKNISFGRLYRPNFMSQKSTVGKQILQYCLQNMGGHQFQGFDILTEVAPGHSKTKAFDDLEDEDLDKGFDFLKQNAPRSSSDLQQLRGKQSSCARELLLSMGGHMLSLKRLCGVCLQMGPRPAKSLIGHDH